MHSCDSHSSSSCASPCSRVTRTFARLRAALLFSAVAVVAMPVAHAQRTWVGAGANGNWSLGENWSSPMANSYNGAITFSGSNQTSTSNDLTGVVASSLIFEAGASPFTISGTQFTLSGAVTALTNNSGVTQTIDANLNIIASGNAVKSIGLTGNIVINGALSGDSSLALNPTSGAGTLFLNGNNVNYLGSVRIQTGRNLVLGHNNAAGGGTLQWLGGGTLDVTSGSSFISTANLSTGQSNLPFVGSGNLAFTGATSK